MSPVDIPAWIVITPNGTAHFNTVEAAETWAASHALNHPGHEAVLYAFQRRYHHAILSNQAKGPSTLQ